MKEIEENIVELFKKSPKANKNSPFLYMSKSLVTDDETNEKVGYRFEIAYDKNVFMFNDYEDEGDDYEWN